MESRKNIIEQNLMCDLQIMVCVVGCMRTVGLCHPQAYYPSVRGLIARAHRSRPSPSIVLTASLLFLIRSLFHSLLGFFMHESIIVLV